MGRNLTKDGLPIVTEDTFLQCVREFPISSPDNDPEVAQRIRDENPQIGRIIRLGMKSAPNREAQAYYEAGCQLTYELLRRQSKSTS